MEKLDRGLQHLIPLRLAAEYPAQCTPEDLGFPQNDTAWSVNLHYLAEHGLVEITASQELKRGPPAVVLARATARGLDFLQNDGGLGAILNIVTVRLEDETLKALTTRIDSSDLPPAEKSAIKKKLSEMGSEALKELTKKLVAEAITKWPDALRLIQSWLS